MLYGICLERTKILSIEIKGKYQNSSAYIKDSSVNLFVISAHRRRDFSSVKQWIPNFYSFTRDSFVMVLVHGYPDAASQMLSTILD